jgi:hypothetical protein
MFCSKRRTRPNANSIAEKTKKKKVKDITFRLSKINPIKRTIAYKVIHNNSAVKSRCREVLVFIKILKRIKKKNKNNIFKLSTIILKN